MRRNRGDRVLAWCLGLVLVILHADFWRPQRAVLYMGWLPEELLYRLLWMIGAWAFLAFFCVRIWRGEKE